MVKEHELQNYDTSNTYWRVFDSKTVIIKITKIFDLNFSNDDKRLPHM